MTHAPSSDRVTYLGHATVLLEIGGSRILTDPILRNRLAHLRRRGPAPELVPALWLPSLDDRALRERLKRRMPLVRMRTMARNRIHGVLTQWGLKLRPRGCASPTVWRCWRRAGCGRCGAARSPRRWR